ncbi:uncharacterized protein LOC130794424 isoform X2 [Actinidia eriantha]|uniref:uncharacterized protein LOC130794424 isoform X2 n=1 Tax=Actinidia eriantha TaxID=165200 RepID=UPI0025860FCD|nr:uncharacterized protein LOC130794424 isoform X2 [Actinidia eriantha]
MVSSNLSVIHQKIKHKTNKFITKFGTLLLLSGLVLYITYTISSHHPCCQSSTLFTTSTHKYSNDPYNSNSFSPTNISHIVFGIASSSNTWKNKKPYIAAWWRPNTTRGSLFLDKPPTEYLPWPSKTDPPFRVSEDVSKYKEYDKHSMPYVIRIARIIVETFRAENKNVRWYVMVDDDTVLFINNLVEVLAKYDHRKYYYIGKNSECVVNNVQGSFEMAFGGAGYALSYPLAEALVTNFDLCIKRYPYLYGSDHILQSCVADLGVSLTLEKGFHQIDLRGDISGLLSAHPQSPFLSLHHLEAVNPIFPFLNRYDSINHLMKAAQADESRLLQQTACYHKRRNWTFSVSWGYSAQIYENIFPPSVLQRPLETFIPWKKGAFPPYVFNTRLPSNDPCEAPHFFFFDSVEHTIGGRVVTSYTRRWERKLPGCSSSGNHSADHISKIHVVSPIGRLISGVSDSSALLLVWLEVEENVVTCYALVI